MPVTIEFPTLGLFCMSFWTVSRSLQDLVFATEAFRACRRCRTSFSMLFRPWCVWRDVGSREIMVGRRALAFDVGGSVVGWGRVDVQVMYLFTCSRADGSGEESMVACSCLRARLVSTRRLYRVKCFRERSILQ